jgi:sterol desaturase/sphingolipid hydroxylase (fatty acid hydroxylase superfamily)
MAIHDPRELRLVLIPAAGVLGVVLTLAPVAALVGWLLTPNAGWLMLVTAGLYMVTYELTHMSYHLRPDSFIGRMSLIRVLRRHHARHHDPHLMQKWNFNVTVPVFDWILGTIAPHEDAAAGTAASELAPPRADGEEKAPASAREKSHAAE